ncbi:hypothetical protein [Quatrionicoccus australiensis]|uniref:hypothetical protein n=1 Tax=Quatrionicoccus australiensis TaxID=138118 RepID=UPI001CFA7B1E|nr:hypothetical protein [Quatrionicoccus australiensis]MCB4361526.1 hypothetical protein [Quatrionicoccus australiensis]
MRVPIILLGAEYPMERSLKPQLTACPSQGNLISADLSAFDTIDPMGVSATWLLAHLGGRPALSLLLAGMSLPRRRFALVIPPKRTNSRVQPRFQGSLLQERQGGFAGKQLFFGCFCTSTAGHEIR